jgi:hypothetical protein
LNVYAATLAGALSISEEAIAFDLTRACAAHSYISGHNALLASSPGGVSRWLQRNSR